MRAAAARLPHWVWAVVRDPLVWGGGSGRPSVCFPDPQTPHCSSAVGMAPFVMYVYVFAHSPSVRFVFPDFYVEVPPRLGKAIGGVSEAIGRWLVLSRR